MRKLSDKSRIAITIFILFLFLCLPIFFAPSKTWLNIALLVLTVMLPFLIVGGILNKLIFLKNPYIKLAFSWLLVGLTFFLISSMIFLMSKYSWESTLKISAQWAAVAMLISLVWYLLSIMFKKIFSHIR